MEPTVWADVLDQLGGSTAVAGALVVLLVGAAGATLNWLAKKAGATETKLDEGLIAFLKSLLPGGKR